MTAAALDVPIDRMRELRPFAAAVSDTGTAPMISAGIDEYDSPTPAPMIMPPTTIIHTEDDRKYTNV